MRLLGFLLPAFAALAVVDSTAELLGEVMGGLTSVAGAATSDSGASTGTVASTKDTMTCSYVLKAAKIVSAVANSTGDATFIAIAATVSAALTTASQNSTLMSSCYAQAIATGNTADAAVCECCVWMN